MTQGMTASEEARGVADTNSVRPEREMSLWRLRPRSVLLEVALAALVAIATSGAFQWLVLQLEVSMPSFVPTAITSVSAAVLVLALVGLVVRGRRRWRPWYPPATWVVLSALSTLALALPLQGTKYYLHGLSSDMAFRTQYLSKLTETTSLVDMAYADTAPYYPGAWFWLGARVANLFGLSGWETFKPWAILTLAVMSAVCFPLWSMVVRRHLAALLAFATAVVGLREGATEPYAWIIAAALPAIAVIAMRALDNGLAPTESGDDKPRPAGRGHLVALIAVGVFIGISGAVYTLYFGFAVFVVVLLACTALPRARTTHGRWPAFRVLLLRLVIIGAVALPVMLAVWAPYLVEALTNDRPEASAAQRFLPEASAVFPFPMFEFSASGIACLIGLIWVLVRLRASDVARALGIVVLGVYLWFALSTLALSMDMTLIPFRLRVPLMAALTCAGVLGAADGARAIYRRVAREHRRNVAVAVIVAGVLGAVSLAQSVPTFHSGELREAYQDYYPTGVNALGESDPAHPGSWYDDLNATITKETGRRPIDLVLLSDNYELACLFPYWTFQQATPHSGNPLAGFDGRRAEVARWAQAKDSRDLLNRLDSGPYRAPRVFVLRKGPDGYYLRLTKDSFPKEPNVESYDVVFGTALFSPDLFTIRDVGPYTVVIRR